MKSLRMLLYLYHSLVMRDSTLYKALKKGAVSNAIFGYLGIGVFIFVFISMLVSGKVKSLEDILSLFLTLGLVGAVLYYMYRDQFRGPKYWTKLIENRPEELVWIKPILVESRLWFVVKVGESHKVELLTSKGVKTEFVGSESQLDDLLKAIAQHAPHVHYGYSREIEKVYKRKKQRFIEVLRKENLHAPLIKINNESLEK